MLSRLQQLIQTVLTQRFHRDGYVYEERYDGWRMVAYKDGRRARLVSRRGVDHSQRFAEIARSPSMARFVSSIRAFFARRGLIRWPI